MSQSQTPEASDPNLENATTAAEAQPVEAPFEPAPQQDPKTTLEEEVTRWKDLAYRSQAELDNFRKRSAREAQPASMPTRISCAPCSPFSTTSRWVWMPPAPNRKSR